MGSLKDNSGWYWEVVIHHQPSDVELVTWYAFERGASGVEEIGVKNGLAERKVYFPSSEPDPKRLFDENQIKAELADTDIRCVSAERVQISDWQDNWREYFKPIEVGRRLLVRPSWEEAPTQRKEIVIYPGRGFGTGYHESTKLALELLEALLDQYKIGRAVDVGAGSGILTIAALLLDVKHVTAVDIDECVLEEIPRNINLSGLSLADWAVRYCDVKSFHDEADLVMANIEDHILSQLTDKLVSMVKEGGFLLLSGILLENKDPLIQGFSTGFTRLSERVEGEWYSCVYQKTG